MLYQKKFRDADLAKRLIDKISATVKHHWSIMEICGGQTHAIMQYGLHQLLPEKIELIHGPGCPVCVTSLELIDKALIIASNEKVIFTSYGDMLRVPGSHGDLFSIRAAGGDVRIVYSPLDAVRIAADNPDKEVVFFAIGFETTAPPNIASVLQAKALGIRNFSILVSQVRVPPAIRTILCSPGNRVQAFLAAGHVCTVMGYWEYLPLAEEFKIPIVVTGFEPLDLLQGIYLTVQQLEKNEHNVINGYARAVSQEGNRHAQSMIEKTYCECDRQWRGIGMIPMSGWCLRDEFSEFDAEKRFQVENIKTHESEICIAGLILQGQKKPYECPAFGTLCTPQTPLGATMVSSEGVCAAYYRYGQRNDDENE